MHHPDPQCTDVIELLCWFMHHCQPPNGHLDQIDAELEVFPPSNMGLHELLQKIFRDGMRSLGIVPSHLKPALLCISVLQKEMFRNKGDPVYERMYNAIVAMFMAALGTHIPSVASYPTLVIRRSSEGRRWWEVIVERPTQLDWAPPCTNPYEHRLL